MISDLQEYEEIPSDELIALAVSDKYRMRDTAKTIEGERARLELSKEILCQSNWREYEFVDFVSDTGDTYSRVRSYPASGSHFKSVFHDAEPQTKLDIDEKPPPVSEQKADSVSSDVASAP